MLTIRADGAGATALREALVPRLEDLGELARQAGASLAFRPPEGALRWLAAAPGCPRAGDPCAPDACASGMTCGRIEVAYEGTPAGSVILCIPRGATRLLESLRGVVQTAVRCAELECGEVAMLQELSAAWESLEAVSEVSAGMRSKEGTGALLDRIMSRAVGFQDGLQAVLWLQRDGRLEPAVSRCRAGCQPRAPGGLVGRALADHAGVILNDPARIAAIGDLEPELRGALSVAVAPVTTNQGLLGALVIWREDGPGDFDSRTMFLAGTLALQAAMVAENDRLNRAAMENERLRQEVEIGSVIQQTLLLGIPPDGMRAFRVATLAVPSALVDGDFYDFFRLDDGTLDVVVGDVMGKGVPAALVGAATKSQLLRALGVLRGTDNPLPAVADVVAAVHDSVVPQLIEIERFVTLCYARFEAAARRLTLVDCGHTRTVHYHSRDRSVSLLQGFDSPLGFSADAAYRSLAVPFEAGDVFFFYSDGLTESRGPGGEAFGEARLAEIVAARGDRAPAALVELVRQAVVAFRGSSSFADDLTCVALQVSPPLRRFARNLHSDLSCLGAVRDFVAEACGTLPAGAVDQEVLGCFTLAVNEAASNVVRHAYGGRTGQPLRIEADVFDDRLEVVLRHQGRHFAPAPGHGAPPTEPREGGLGLFIIRQFAENVEYSVDALGYAYTRLVKRLCPL
jgi:sigma-B regulation protein RsbU (phosphoserine phosphatase)